MLNKVNAILEALLRTDGVRLHRLLYRLTLSTEVAEDLLQELCIKLLSSATFAAAEQPTGFAIRAAVHLGLDWRRLRQRRRTCDLPEDLRASEMGVLELASRQEEIECVLDAVQRIPEPLREILVLRYVEGESYEKIANIMGKDPHLLRALAHKGIRAVRTILSSTESPRHRRKSHA